MKATCWMGRNTVEVQDVPAELPPGRYTVRVQAIDARGNLERATTRKLRVR